LGRRSWAGPRKKKEGRREWAAGERNRRGQGEGSLEGVCCFLLKMSFSFLFKTILQTEFEFNSNKV
jgi:hypothetical protein